jgi:putative ABC transport system permease protein
MKSYLALSGKYLSAHKRKTGLTVISVIMAVTLVVGIFSMLDSMIKFERTQILETEGNYHILIRNPSNQEIDRIGGRIDVKGAGLFKDIGYGNISGLKCALASIDAGFAENMNVDLSEGKYPAAGNEAMVEKWYAGKTNPALKPGDTVILTLPDGKESNFVISGIFKDWGATKAAGIPGVFISTKLSEQLKAQTVQYFILFKDDVNIINTEAKIKKELGIQEDRIGRNEGLLALMGQSKNNRVQNFYAIGFILFCLVLLTAVVMIYNTFNISVMDRVRQFGVLRCIGASRVQIRRLVRREGMFISLKAIPIGVLAGMLMSIACSAVLKYYNGKLYGNIPLFNLSPLGIGAGVTVGFLTVTIASLLPAKKASGVSPVNAIRGSNEEKISKRNKKGLLIKLFHAETGMGIGNAFRKKKTLFLMSSSIALSIIMFLGFNALVNPAILGSKPIKAYTSDLSLRSEQAIGNDITAGLSGLHGVKRVYGRMSEKLDITFMASKLTNKYRTVIQAKSGSDGMLADPEKSWLVSYNSTQIQWAQADLSAGEFDEEQLNKQNGIIAVETNWRNNAMYQATSLKPGDKVYVRTVSGVKPFTVLGVVVNIPYGTTDDPTLVSFITTEKLFEGITGVSGYKNVDIQLENKNQEQTVNEIKKIAGTSMTFSDRRQYNEESNNAYMTVALFFYGFVGVIALVSILNIINTMNTSVAARTRYLGVMRAIGMTGSQLSGMVLSEAVIYSLFGCLTGSIIGIALHRALSMLLLERWTAPVLQVILIFAACMLAASLSIISPLRRIRSKGISEVINAL